MATVCGCWLAMHDAGVPLTSTIAGVAMGMLQASEEDEDDSEALKKEGNTPIILTDILGLEDALGCMDLKIAGNETGITAFQLDIKASGLSYQILEKAFNQVLC
jgi:polyribonucleotide nucleotidyltransferase